MNGNNARHLQSIDQMLGYGAIGLFLMISIWLLRDMLLLVFSAALLACALRGTSGVVRRWSRLGPQTALLAVVAGRTLCTGVDLRWLFATGKGVRCITICSAITLAVSPAIAQTTAPAPPAIGQDDQLISKSVEVEPAAGDTAIASRIQRILQSTDWFQNPRVSVREGIVFIEGKTKTQAHFRWASALAQKTQGTVAVVNRIGVEADIGSTFGHAGEEFEKTYRQALQVWPWILIAVVILMITWLTARLAAHLARRFFVSRIPSPLLLSVIVRLFSIPVFLLGFYFVLQVAGLTRLALTVLGGTGLFGIIVGFAFRDIAENFLSSILLSVRNPFRTGDLIEVDGNTGIVQNLNIRSTVLLTLDGHYVQIPNAVVFKSTIMNYSSSASRRADFSVGISYDSSTTKAQALIANVLKQHPAVLDVPEPLVLVEELGMATVNLRVYYWFVSAIYSPIKINSALLRLTKDALLGAGIELPDAAREVVFPKGIPIVPADAHNSKFESPKAEGSIHCREERLSAAIGEGNLSNEQTEVSAQSRGQAPEAKENLLKE
ncbi:mechanosensitive ion channel family protein [Bradyrhizobium roseum]|uniref:mechanosensitive ion channel family protein n=1 Tax=Bradyrhizobium roseum TaxID=3056648 RepID=UPI0026353D0F|nr:mechanosensitive ion channel family protein [Bradyrhizobium roseus]WKA29450.1 mechanosensitive ion channel family protein [Bradyrhizobium roseus]